MLKNRKILFIENSLRVFPFTCSLFISFFALRLYEYLIYSHLSENENIKIGYFIGGLLLDFLLSNLIVIGVSLLVSFFTFRKINKTSWLHFISIICLLANYVLIQVFFKTREPLDSMVFNFNLSEIITITSGEASFTKIFLEIFILFGVFYLSYFLFRKIKFSPKASKIYVISSLLLIFLIPLINYSSTKHIATKLVPNKLAFFCISCSNYLFEENESYTTNKNIDANFLAGKQIDKDYPFLHSFIQQDEFANLFHKKDEKAPNLVFIIVESLSTKFTGEYGKNTLKVTPFLDSLSEKSIYFPNIIATAERTFGVLPAVFCSTPNAPKNEYLMNMDYPNLNSLTEILKKDYFSRFYCGVYLEFHNMKNFMQYIKTDYLVKDWEKQFDPNFHADNSWGHPDNQLFDKVLLDSKTKHASITKPKLDIILTVSTHPPYLVPNQEKYKNEILKDIQSKKIKSKYAKTIQKNLDVFSTFRFTDQTLKKYFKAMQKSPEYQNTIFFIMGDHGSEMNAENELTKVTVPLMIVSDLIKKPEKFDAFSSHLDILPSVLSLLQKNYKIAVPQNVAFMGKGLRLNSAYQTETHLPVASINYKNDFMVYGKYYLYYNQLFEIKKNLHLKALNDPKKEQELKQKLNAYNNVASYCYFENKLIPKDLKINDFSYIPVLKSENEFIHVFQDYHFKEKINNFKIEITFEAYLNKETDIKAIPSYVTSINLADSLLDWRSTVPKLNQKFKKGWNKMKYTIPLDESILNNQSNLKLEHYILNIKKQKISLKNLKYKTYKNI